MLNSPVEVQAPPAWRKHVRAVEHAASAALLAWFPAGTAVCVRLVGDVEMRALQRTFRHKRGLTDVLSFASDEPGYAGDVAICLSVAEQQARALGHPLAVELSVLTVHALAHLWGLDHERGPDEARHQAEVEMSLLDGLGIPVGAALSRRGM